MVPKVMELTFAAATDVGRQRDHNEDNFLIDKKLRLFIVADGMGGHAAGEVASSITVHQIRDAVFKNRDLIDSYGSDDSDVDAVQLLQILEHSIQAACSEVYARAQAEQGKRGMGTTASALLVAGAPGKLRGFIAHVGDSRVYLVRQNQTHQLTEDHSLQNELIKRGKLKREEFDSSPYKKFKNAVTRAVGVYASVEVDTFDLDILPGDRYLLCSDGLYPYFEEADLPELLVADDVRTLPQSLVDMANEGGGHDNITAVVLRVGAAEETQTRAAELSLKLEVLKGMPMFRYLSYKELVRVMNITHTETFEDGASIFEEGDPGDAMHVVLGGSVSMLKGDVTIAELGKGEHFGEMSLVDRSTRSLTATARDHTLLLSIRRKEFYGIIKQEPTLAVKLLWSFVQTLALRLRKTTQDMSSAAKGEHSGEPSDENLFQD